MATRRATRKFETTEQFIEAYEQELTNLSLSLPTSSYRGAEISNSIKLDIVVPGQDRIGPINATVVFRAPDGTVAVQLDSMEPKLTEAYENIKIERFGAIKPFIESGLVVLKTEYDALLEKLNGMEEQLANRVQEAVDIVVKEIEERHKVEILELRQALAENPISGSKAVEGRVTQRGLVVPRTDHLTPLFQAECAKNGYQDLLIQIASGSHTGLLIIKQNEQTRYGYIDEGYPVGWRSDPLKQSEVLGMLLLQAGQLTQEQVAKSLKLMEENQIRQGQAFLELDLINHSQLKMILGKQCEYIFEQTLSIQNGTVEFYELDSLPEKFIAPRLSVATVLYQRLHQKSRQLSFEEIGRSTAVHLNHYVYISEMALPILETMKLSKEERKLIGIIQSKPYRLREVFSVSPLSKGKTSSFVYSFERLKFFVYSESEGGVRTKEQFTDRIKSLIRMIQRGSYFDILEVHWICLPNEVDTAYNRKKKEFSDEAVVSFKEEFGLQIEQIRSKVEQAYQAIRTDTARREYRAKVVERDLMINSAELLSKKGEMAIMRYDKREACACFSKALELVPGSAAYRDGLRRATVISR